MKGRASSGTGGRAGGCQKAIVRGLRRCERCAPNNGEQTRRDILPSMTTRFVTASAVSVVIWTGPKCRDGNPSRLRIRVRSKGGSSPRMPPKRKTSNALLSDGAIGEVAFGSRRQQRSSGMFFEARRARMPDVWHAAFAPCPGASARSAGRGASSADWNEASEPGERDVKCTVEDEGDTSSMWAYSSETHSGTGFAGAALEPSGEGSSASRCSAR